MLFFKSLVNKLISDDDATFQRGMNKAVSIADSGNYSGVEAMREAIRIKCGNHEADIYEYGASSKKISHTEARSKIIDLAERNALLDDVYHSGSLVSAFMQRASLDGDDARSLLSAVNRAGGLLKAMLSNFCSTS